MEADPLPASPLLDSLGLRDNQVMRAWKQGQNPQQV